MSEATVVRFSEGALEGEPLSRHARKARRASTAIPPITPPTMAPIGAFFDPRDDESVGKAENVDSTPWDDDDDDSWGVAVVPEGTTVMLDSGDVRGIGGPSVHSQEPVLF